MEREFGVLQAKWHIGARPSKLWYKSSMNDIVRCCIILKNMIVDHRVVGEGVYNKVAADTLIVIGENAPVRWRTGRASEQPAAPAGSLPALCAVQTLIENLEEYNKTRSLVLSHLWDVNESELLCEL